MENQVFKKSSKKDYNLGEIYESILKDMQENCDDVFVAPRDMRVGDDGKFYMQNQLDMMYADKPFSLNEWSKSQICLKMKGLTPKYWDAMPEWLRAINANHWLEDMGKQKEYKGKMKDPYKFMLRLRKGGEDQEGNELPATIRAFVSEIYSKFDDHELVSIVKEIMETKPEFAVSKIARYHRSDMGMSLRILFNEPVEIGEVSWNKEKLQKDVHYRGILIENSEVGRKSIRIKPFIYRVVCTNGLVAYSFDGDAAFKQRHMGVTREEIMENVYDAMGKALNATQESIDLLKKAKRIELTKEEAEKHIERYSKECKYDKKFVEEVKEQFGREHKSNVFHLVQAFTYAVHNPKTKFGGYRNEDDRVRVEQDAMRLLERLAA